MATAATQTKDGRITLSFEGFADEAAINRALAATLTPGALKALMKTGLRGSGGTTSGHFCTCVSGNNHVTHCACDDPDCST